MQLLALTTTSATCQLSYTSVCVTTTTVSSAKTTEPLRRCVGGGQPRVGPINYVLNNSIYGHHMMSTIEQSVLSDTATCYKFISVNISTDSFKK